MIVIVSTGRISILASDHHAYVNASWDPEAGVWVAQSLDPSGLVAEAPTMDDLEAKIPIILRDLLRP